MLISTLYLGALEGSNPDFRGCSSAHQNPSGGSRGDGHSVSRVCNLVHSQKFPVEYHCLESRTHRAKRDSHLLVVARGALACAGERNTAWIVFQKQRGRTIVTILNTAYASSELWLRALVKLMGTFLAVGGSQIVAIMPNIPV